MKWQRNKVVDVVTMLEINLCNRIGNTCNIEWYVSTIVPNDDKKGHVKDAHSINR